MDFSLSARIVKKRIPKPLEKGRPTITVNTTKNGRTFLTEFKLEPNTLRQKAAKKPTIELQNNGTYLTQIAERLLIFLTMRFVTVRFGGIHVLFVALRLTRIIQTTTGRLMLCGYAPSITKKLTN